MLGEEQSSSLKNEVTIVNLTKHRRIRHTSALEVPASRTSSSSCHSRLGSSSPTSCWWRPPTTRPSNSEGKVENPLGSSINCLHVGTCGTQNPTSFARQQHNYGLGKLTVSETPCQREGTTVERHHPSHLTCEDAHSMMTVSKNCDNDDKNKVQSSVQPRQQLIVIAQV